MRTNFFNTAWAAATGVLLLLPWAFAGHPGPASSAPEERAIRALILEWRKAYQNHDAKQLAALETPEVEVLDRFGKLRLPAGRNENETLWSDTFEAVSRSTRPPTVTVDHIRFLRPDVALVQASWQFPEGILLVDGDRIAPFSQVDTYVVIKSQNGWLIAAHNMQDKTP